MMHDYVKPSVTAALLLLSTQLVLSQQDCVLKKEEGDLKVYTCVSENEKLKTLKTELILRNTSFKKLLDFLKDIDYYVNWQYNMIEVEVLQKEINQPIIYRAIIQAPWPVSNREMITEMYSEYDSAAHTLIIITHSVKHDYPEDPDLVRVPFSEGIWRVSSLDDASLKIEYTLRIDPGGSVPLWLVNMAMAEGPFYSFSNLKEKLQQQTSGVGIQRN